MQIPKEWLNKMMNRKSISSGLSLKILFYKQVNKPFVSTQLLRNFKEHLRI